MKVLTPIHLTALLLYLIPVLSLEAFEPLRMPVEFETLTPQDPAFEEAYEDKTRKFLFGRNWVITAGDGDPDTGKRDWPALLAKMWLDRDDNTALQEWIDTEGIKLRDSRYAGTFYKPFSVPGYNMFYFTFKDFNEEVGLSPEQEAGFEAIEEWSYLTREDNYMDPIYNQTEFNSENFNWKARLGGLQWAFVLPDTDLGLYEYNWQAGTSKGMSREYFRNYADNWIRALYHAGRVEWNSSIYWGYTFVPILTLYEYPPVDPDNPGYTEKVRLQARAAADWLVLELALHYLDGFFGGPETRAKSAPHTPFWGSTAPYSYLYFVDEENHPSYQTGPLLDSLDAGQPGWFPWSSYRPLRVLRSIANRDFELPLEIQSAKPFYHLDHDNYASWRGEGSYEAWKADKEGEEQAYRTGFRYEFETIYMDTNYLLASVASYRPDGSIGTFSEHNQFRLMVRGSNAGAIQVMGNTAAFATPAGRDPYEQTAQVANVLMRMIKQSREDDNRIWFGIPKSATKAWDGDRLFVDMGQDVYFALIPYGSSGTTVADYTQDNFGLHDKVTWSFPARQLGAIAMEVGTAGEHGSFDSFQTAFDGRELVPGIEEESLAFTSSQGTHMTMQWTGIVRYPMTEDGGRTLRRAGTIPRTWRDGEEVDYGSWNVYEVVSGERIVHQEWGSGRLYLSAGGESVEIAVDPETSEVTYFETEGWIAEPPGPARYAAWQASHFTAEQLDAGLGDMDADPEGDLISNLAEYAMKLDPWQVDPDGGHPFFSVADGDPGLVLEVSIPINPDAVDLSAGLELLRSSTPSAWVREETIDPVLEGLETEGPPMLKYQIPLEDPATLGRVIYSMD